MLSEHAEAMSILEAVPTVPLCQLPTAVERITALDGLRPGSPCFVKRDDCTGLALGGNKARKLEYLLAQARAADAQVLVTASGLQSNHVRQTAAAAAKSGFQFDAIVAPPFKGAPKTFFENGNALLDRIFGANLVQVDDEAMLDEALAEHLEKLRRRGKRYYVIPLGGSDGTGSLGYVRCAWEILAQVATLAERVTHIFLATGSGGTHAGLLAGLRLAGSDMKVVGISVSDTASEKKETVRNVLSQLSDRFGALLPQTVFEEVTVYDDWSGQGYARPTSEGDDWIVKAARSDGLLLDPVYTGKAFAGMAALIRDGSLDSLGSPMFLHTGGVPSLFADPQVLERTRQSTDAFCAVTP